MKRNKTTWLLRLLITFLLVSTHGPVNAVEFGGVDFPMGRFSFADRVVSFDLNDSFGVGPQWDDPEETLGPPNYTGADDDTNYLCLGNTSVAGTPSELIVAFDDNRLVDVDGDDLYVFEIGASVEATSIAVSVDGETWYGLGRIEGATSAIDLADHADIPAGSSFQYVRLRDFPDGVTSDGPWGGPDIDAIGAIGSVAPTDVGDADSQPSEEALSDMTEEAVSDEVAEVFPDAGVEPDAAVDVASDDQDPTVQTDGVVLDANEDATLEEEGDASGCGCRFTDGEPKGDQTILVIGLMLLGMTMTTRRRKD